MIFMVNKKLFLESTHWDLTCFCLCLQKYFHDLGILPVMKSNYWESLAGMHYSEADIDRVLMLRGKAHASLKWLSGHLLNKSCESLDVNQTQVHCCHLMTHCEEETRHFDEERVWNCSFRTRCVFNSTGPSRTLLNLASSYTVCVTAWLYYIWCRAVFVNCEAVIAL